MGVPGDRYRLGVQVLWQVDCSTHTYIICICASRCEEAPLEPTGRSHWSVDDGDQVAFLDYVAFGDVHAGDRAGAFGDDRDLHLHRLEDDQGVAVVDLITFGRDHFPHVRDHLRADLSHRRLLSVTPGRLARGAACLPGTYRSPR